MMTRAHVARRQDPETPGAGATNSALRESGPPEQAEARRTGVCTAGRGLQKAAVNTFGLACWSQQHARKREQRGTAQTREHVAWVFHIG